MLFVNARTNAKRVEMSFDGSVPQGSSQQDETMIDDPNEAMDINSIDNPDLRELSNSVLK